MAAETTHQQVGRAVRMPKTAEIIATDLRGQIVRGELTEGDTLPPESALMVQYNVSRPTLREAFRILETETLISVRRGSRGGAQVTHPSITVAARAIGLMLQIQQTTINDVYEARLVSEPACAALLAKNRTERDLDDLRAVIDELEALVNEADNGQPNPETWADHSFRIHALIMERCGNRTLATQGAVLQDIIRTHIHARVSASIEEGESSERFRLGLRGYRRLLELVTEGDAEGARAHWVQHMTAAAQYLLKDELNEKRVVDLFAKAHDRV